ncbi:hypothetical protein [uncultured Pontibacter sp.]|uniref:hypothetical protein n=1 Tax=uncultured Pontibacter sp. TaxID=453356 RepID=UPI00260F74CD|nr:hypothetical protein [uncultured Pontibacter sp.]
MKRTLLLALAWSALSLAGCTSSLYPEIDERLTTIPTQPHNNEIEVFFRGEWPQEEYIKLAAIEVHGGENTAYIDMIRGLQMKARRYGADAVMVQENNLTGDVYSNRVGNIETARWSILSAVAIKYRKNLDTGLMPKYQQVEVYDRATNAFQPVLTLAFTPDGVIQEKEELHENAAVIYNNYIGKYTMQNLRQSGAGWSHRTQEGYVVERQLHRDGMLQKSMEFDYDTFRRLKRIRIKSLKDMSEEINYAYDEEGRLSQRTILRSDRPYIQEEYTYDASGKANQVLIYNTNLPVKSPLLRSTYTYYTLEEI